MFFKDPGSITAYTIDWAPWLGTDTISSSTWIVPVGITKTSDANTTTAFGLFIAGNKSSDASNQAVAGRGLGKLLYD